MEELACFGKHDVVRPQAGSRDTANRQQGISQSSMDIMYDRYYRSGEYMRLFSPIS